MNTMPALSIQQPWTWLIVNGHKTIENRDYQPMRFGQAYRGRLLLHAGLRGDEHWYIKHGKHDFLIALWAQYLEAKGLSIHTGRRADYPRGGIVGIATIADVVTTSDDPWFVGKYGWVLKDVQPLPFIPLKGSLRLFEVDMSMLTPLIDREVLK
jgi:hypothetical protein